MNSAYKLLFVEFVLAVDVHSTPLSATGLALVYHFDFFYKRQWKLELKDADMGTPLQLIRQDSANSR